MYVDIICYEYSNMLSCQHTLYAVLESSWRTLCLCVCIVLKELKVYKIWWEILEQVNNMRLHLLPLDLWLLLIFVYVCRCKIMGGNTELASLNIKLISVQHKMLWNIKTHAGKLLAATFQNAVNLHPTWGLGSLRTVH